MKMTQEQIKGRNYFVALLTGGFLFNLIETRSIFGAVCGTAGLIPVLLFAPWIFLTVHERTGSNFLAGAAMLIVSFAYIVVVLWLFSHLLPWLFTTRIGSFLKHH